MQKINLCKTLIRYSKNIKREYFAALKIGNIYLSDKMSY